MATKEVESWDDDLELQGPIYTQASTTRAGSISSRLSFRSESNAAEDDWNVPVAPNDEQSINNAITSAKLAGIPIPSDVPSSALLGGTIKRLGNKKPSQAAPQVEDWADDLGVSEHEASTLKIKPPTHTQTPAAFDDEQDDLDWGDGSLGVRFGGTKKAFQNRSSSTSIMSPSAASAGTLESEEDGLGGLVLPTGPVDFETALRKRKDAPPSSNSMHAPSKSAEEFKPSTNASAAAAQNEDYSDIDFGAGDIFDPRKATLNRNVRQNFKPTQTPSPGPRTQTSLTFTDKSTGTRLPRPVSTPKTSRLEPVYESGATSVTRPRRPEPTTTGAQLLRSKRSMPVLRPNQSSTRTQPPVVQFLPLTAGTSSQQRTGTTRMSHNPRRDSDPTRPQSPNVRMQSRLVNAASPDTPTRPRRDLASAALAREAVAKKTVTRPTRKRNYGDGTELDTIDDLPTSAAKESLYMKQPVAKPPPKGLRTQPSTSRLNLRDKMTTPLPAAPPKSPTKAEHLPHFARDTTASRIAREQKLASGKPRTEGPLMPRTNLQPQMPNRTPLSSPVAHSRQAGKGPQLVRQLGKENLRHFQEDAEKKGMHWNAMLCKWEGNENALIGFDPPAPPSPPRPALITNVGKPQGVQVVGGMVFDPQRMCWLKLGATPSDPLSPSVGDEDDPFRDIEDLHDTPPTTATASGPGTTAASGDWLVGEEFDLGPEFIRRQREEEEAWKQRARGWFGDERERAGEGYKWAIRDIAATAML